MFLIWSVDCIILSFGGCNYTFGFSVGIQLKGEKK